MRFREGYDLNEIDAFAPDDFTSRPAKKGKYPWEMFVLHDGRYFRLLSQYREQPAVSKCTGQQCE